MSAGAWGALVVTVLAGLACVHPFVLYPLTLRLLPRRPATPSATPGPPPTFSLLFCAYNEIACIDDKLANLARIAERHPGVEVLAYDDASTDGTLERLTARGDLVRVVRGAGRTGKAHGMKLLAAEATGDLLVFTDANVVLDPEALDALAEAYADPEVGGVCGRLLYSASEEETATEAVGGLYWRLEEATKELESRTGNVMGADGSIFSVRRALYPDFPDTVQDDFTVSMSVVVAGSRLVRRSDAVAREALVSSSSEELRRKVRIAARAFHTHLHLRPGVRTLGAVDRYKYVSHKVLRWHAASLLALTAVAGLVFVLLATGPLVTLTLLVVAALAAVALRVLRPGLWAQGVDVLVALGATNWGVWQAMRGRTYQTWQPPPR